MAFDVSTLAAYTKDNAKDLTVSSVLGSKTASLIKAQGNVLVNVKSAENITIMDTDAFFQSGNSCGFNASGTTSFTQRAVTVGRIKINEALCLKDLETKFLQQALPQGSRYTEMIFAEQYTNRKAEKVAEQLEIAIWQGDTASANGNLNKFDGLLKLITAASTAVTNANTSTYISGGPIASITVANVISVFDAIYQAIPAKVVAKDDITIFCGMDIFRLYTIALKNANLFAYNLDIKADSEFFLPGTTVKVVAVQGLNGTNDLVAMRLSNLFFGTDLLDEQESRFELFFAKEADQIRYVNEFKAGVNFAFPDEVVKFFI
jgi:hypothetical protein